MTVLFEIYPSHAETFRAFVLKNAAASLLVLNTGHLPDGSIHAEDLVTLREVGGHAGASAPLF
ncbi:MAG: hypothetical protein L0338_22075 [Acidobacteria bacterium]|nr:hypothetical protein [Acidobacteriota bacterium]